MIQAGKEFLDGGPSDGEIRACNSQFLRMTAEEKALELWELGKSMGLLEGKEKAIGRMGEEGFG